MESHSIPRHYFAMVNFPNYGFRTTLKSMPTFSLKNRNTLLDKAAPTKPSVALGS